MPPFLRRVTPFRAADLAAVQSVAGPAGVRWDQWLEMGRQYEAAGNGFTIWQHRESGPVPVFCGGAVERNAHYASLWSVHAPGRGAYMLFVTRATRNFIAGQPYRRMDTLVEAADPAAVRWAELLGLETEARLRGAAGDGGDMLVMVRFLPPAAQSGATMRDSAIDESSYRICDGLPDPTQSETTMLEEAA